jgi:hypothetical protein
MTPIKRFFLYIKYYCELDDKTLRKEAYDAASKYYSDKPLRSSKNPYPRISDYARRREEFIAFQRSYKHVVRDMYAKKKLS